MGSLFSSEVPETDIEGYQILHVSENSPAKAAGLEAFFDFIVAFCGIVLVRNRDVFLKLLKKKYNSPIDLKVFSIKTNTFRDVRITPRTDFGGQCVLGLQINFCAIKDAYNFIHHVLEVYPKSPAHFAGLRPFSDYIYGAETDKEHENIDFMTLMKQYDQKPIKIFVYNTDDDTCRSVIIKPNIKLTCSLGCGLGTGYLHRIPVQIDSTGTNPKLKSSVIEQQHVSAEIVDPALPNVSPTAENVNFGQTIDTDTYTVDIENETEEEEREECPKKSAMLYNIGKTIA